MRDLGILLFEEDCMTILPLGIPDLSHLLGVVFSLQMMNIPRIPFKN